MVRKGGGGSPRNGRSGGRRQYSDESDYSDYSDYSDASSEEFQRGSPRGGGGGGGGRGGGGGNQRQRGDTQRTSESKQSSPRRGKKVAPAKGASEKSAALAKGASACPSVFKLVGLQKFFTTHDLVQHDEFDGAVRGMALMCTLMLLVPFQVLSSLGHSYLDEVASQAQRCHGEDGVTYERIYMGYRIILLITLYSCFCGMILSLFYFLFKRTEKEDYRAWHPKARALAILLFFCTSFAICSLITLANWLFDYYLLASSADVCNNSTTLYIFPGLVVSGATFFIGFFLIL